MQKNAMRWNLTTLYKDGEFEKELASFAARLQTFAKKEPPLKEFILELQDLEKTSIDLSSFIDCLLAQDTNDQNAKKWQMQNMEQQAALRTIALILDEKLLKMSDAEFHALLEDPELKPIAFALNERRELMQMQLPLAEEKLITSLSIDGYHAWGDHYQEIVSGMRIEYDGKNLSVGQASNLLNHPDRAVRLAVFDLWEAAWTKEERLIAHVLNHLAGFRLKVYEARGWKEVSKEPLLSNRMQKKTLDTMWQVIDQNKSLLLPFFQKKAELLGLDRLTWVDVSATANADSQKKYSFEEAKELIISNLRAFHPHMADFAEIAFDEGWIEGEDREGKRPGGFCTPFPEHKQSRIFFTYSGTQDNVLTLAHELGHAYHNKCVENLPMMSQYYRMNVAETASTFFEMILMDALLERASTAEDKRALLDLKIARTAIYCMDIQCRYLFETRFYEERKKGTLSAEQLSEMMEVAQKQAFLDSLGRYHPHFWGAKLHFYSTGFPFYNFPYTFGYLFSLGMYAMAKKDRKAFAARYDKLLEDTGRMTTEDLVKKHLHIDFSKPDFWQGAWDLVAGDIKEYLSLENAVSFR